MHVVGNARQREISSLIDQDLGGNIGATDRPKDSVAKDFVTIDNIYPATLSLAQFPAKILTSDIFEHAAVQLSPPSLMEGSRTRPILKVQDGCNNRCAYCVIPFVRGRSRSLAPDAVVGEVRNLVLAGAKEVVLSGINLGSYGRDLAPRSDLATLTRQILDETMLEQLRFSSIEPQDITEDFVALVAPSPRLAQHFHVPLQSGSDRILKAMHRWYRSELYAERMNIIHRLLPHAAIGADVIVGFPGETEEDFRATFNFIDGLPFSYLHVFSFSERPGTAAAKLGSDVPQIVIHERARALRVLSDRKAAAFRRGQVGRTLRALTLARTGEGWTEAMTPNYLKIRVAGHLAANQWRQISVPKEGQLAVALEDASILKDHLSERQVAAVGDGERNVLHAKLVGELPGDALEV